MTVHTSAGSTLEISASTPSTLDASGYNALGGKTLVGEVTNLGEFGREYNVVTHNPLGSRGTQKYKGSFNEGQISLGLGLDTDDAGQILMKQAAKSDNNYSFILTTQNGDKYGFQAQVTSFKTSVGGVDDITNATANLEIQTSSTGVGVVEILA